ncbi:MAG: FMN-binding protein [Clostridia bacterium]
MKKRYKVLIAISVFLVICIIGASILFSRIDANLETLSNLVITDVDLSEAQNGEFIGSYSSFPVSAEVKVTIYENQIQKIEILKHDNGQGEGAESIIDVVIESQSLEVDAISQATYSSKVILTAIRNALLEAGAKPH